MFIKKISIENFKGFSEKKEIEFNFPNWKNNGLNFFVWENNTGKSTVFEWIQFLFNWLWKWKTIDDLKNKNNLSTDLSIELEFIWDLTNILDTKYKKYILNKWKENNEIIRLCRTSKENEIMQQWSKKIKTDIKTLWFWSEKYKQYENPTWLWKDILKYFDIDFIWADTNPDDIAKFWSTTIVWKLINRISEWFKNSDWYKEFEQKYNKVFNEEENSLKSKLKEVWEKAEGIFKNQFWEAKIDFHFEKLDINSYFKNTKIQIDDWTKTYLDEKWSWMQRAIALTLLQVYIEMTTGNEEQKPFYFFIDEPEICLHPLAQIKLIKALNKLSKTQQIFLTTHSPYIFKETEWKINKVKIFTKKDEKIKIENTWNNFGLFWINSPTWWEINYYAYNLPTIEFHNELYWYLYLEKWEDKWIKKFDNEFFITEKSEDKKYPWKWHENEVSLHTFLRNKIHHPEDNTIIDINDLKKSISKMIEFISDNN